MNPDGTGFRAFPLPNPNSSPRIIALGADGNMWFSEHTGNRMGRITPAGQISEYAIPTPNPFPRAIALGGDGTLLRAARTTIGTDVPVLGVNLGHLGFLASVGPEQMGAALEAMLAGDYWLDTRFTLRARVIAADGSKIVLRRGRLIPGRLDGGGRRVWTTALTVEDALRQLEIRTEGPEVSADRARRIPLHGFALEIRTPKTVVLVDGAEAPREVPTTAQNVEEFLADIGAPLEFTDTVLPARTTPLVAGTRVEVTRVRITEETQTVKVDPPVEATEDPELAKGEEKVVEEGAAGERVVIVRITTTNGQETRREELSGQVTQEPVVRKLIVGTKEAAVPPIPDGEVGDRLAE